LPSKQFSGQSQLGAMCCAFKIKIMPLYIPSRSYLFALFPFLSLIYALPCFCSPDIFSYVVILSHDTVTKHGTCYGNSVKSLCLSYTYALHLSEKSNVSSSFFAIYWPCDCIFSHISQMLRMDRRTEMQQLHQCNTLSRFKSKLKTYYFRRHMDN